ncbi:hypothetical protein MRX96_020989 [Rhipicephalus microplus]
MPVQPLSFSFQVKVKQKNCRDRSGIQTDHGQPHGPLKRKREPFLRGRCTRVVVSRRCLTEELSLVGLSTGEQDTGVAGKPRCMAAAGRVVYSLGGRGNSRRRRRCLI